MSGDAVERTSLAWQRTFLALAIASLAAGRGLVPAIGTAAWVIAAAGVAVSIVGFAMARRGPPTAALLIASAALCLLAGTAALVFVLTRR